MKTFTPAVDAPGVPGLMMAGSLLAGAWRRALVPAATPAEAAVALKRAYARRKPQVQRAGSWRSRACR